jgi:pyruvate formate-lyase/glycerol dehydratase family glycyl radical enzyme
VKRYFKKRAMPVETIASLLPRAYNDFEMGNPVLVKTATYLLFRGMALKFALGGEFKRLIHNRHGSFDRTIALRTRDGGLKMQARFAGGRMKVKMGEAPEADVTIVFKNLQTLKEIAGLSPEGVLDYLLTNKITVQGNFSCLLKFAYILSNFMPPRKEKKADGAPPNIFRKVYGDDRAGAEKTKELISRRGKLRGEKSDGVRFLDEPYLQKFSIADFPGLAAKRQAHFADKPAICTERAKLITEHFKETGFELDGEGRKRSPFLRQAGALAHILSSRRPVIHEGSLIAGSTTSKKVGVVLYPEGHAVTIWPELKTAPARSIQPYDISPEDARLMDEEIFPYWSDRNVREHTRAVENRPRYQELEERFVLYFNWKTVALSHTIPDFPGALAGGLEPVIREAERREAGAADGRSKDFYKGTSVALRGVLAYAENLRKEAERLAGEAGRRGGDAQRLEKMASMLRQVPARGARTLDEAVQSLWILWIALHNESTNAGLSLGHLDAWLQPYFEADMEKLHAPEEREEYLRHAVELVGDFMLRCQDHLPLVADVGNKLFGGSSSDQAITLGGLDRSGRSAVCDMTYIFLKATEMLTLRDPNMNARYCPGVNSETYLKRLVELNVVTGATPSIHNDGAMLKALRANGFGEEDARDWVATGCVEPTIPGRHFGHTNCMMFNMVAPLEMALHDGVHPLMEEQVGPRTGDIRGGALATFDDFFKAFEEQLRFLAVQATDYNNSLGRSHREIRPTPILSSLFEGPMEKARDLTEGGARYNTSGVACIGLTDIVDSLMTVKKLVYEEKKVAFPELLDALEVDFRGHEKLHAMIRSKVPKFGSDDPGVNALARRVVDMVYDAFHGRRSYRDGPYLAGFWSMSNHVAFGLLSGALPSGRPAGKPFTPGLTPENVMNVDLPSSIRTIAALPPEKMPNNIAFNVKIAPDSRDSVEETIDRVTAYTKSYFELGGMQIQFNMVTTETLKDAMAHPESYRNLMVRISGYNAYFVELNRDMQLEIIERQQLRV